MARAKAYLEYHDNSTNSHKFYKMEEQKDGSYLCTWGRVGTSGQSMEYDLATAQKKLHEKLKKGYEEC